LQLRAPCYENPERNGTLCVQPLEIFEVTVKERVLVVPLDFERERTIRRFENMIDLMRSSFAFIPIDDRLNNEFMFLSAEFIKRVTQPHGGLGLAATAPDQFLCRYSERKQRRNKRVRLVGEIPFENRLGMVARG